MNPDKTLQGQYAGFVSRFLAYLVDVIVVILIMVVAGITFDVIMRFFAFVPFLNKLQDLQYANNLLGDVMRALAIVGSLAFITMGYFVIGWSVTGGQSVGKLLIGLRIVPMNGSKISIWRAILRYFAFLLSAVVLFIGLLWVMISDTRQGWHDKIAKTCVIYDWPAREDDGVVGRMHSRWKYIKHTRRRIRGQSADEITADSDSGADAPLEETETAQG